MYFQRYFTNGAIIICLFLSAAAAGQMSAVAQQAKLSSGEVDALKKINGAKDVNGKIAAAGEFIKKYPKSEKRLEVAQHLAEQIGAVTDAPERITLIEKYVGIFTAEAEGELIKQTLLDAYIVTGKTGDAFGLAETWLQKNPDDIATLQNLAVLATNESIKGNNNFLKQGREYGLKAIAQIEADRKPPTMELTAWTTYKTTNLVALYREVGVLATRAGDAAAARSNFEKAAALKSKDPIVYLMLSDMLNTEYMQQAQRYKAMPPGAAKDAELTRGMKLLDGLIEIFAQTVAVSEGHQQYAAAAQAVRGDLETYYKFRNNGSTTGLQALIDKYKQP